MLLSWICQIPMLELELLRSLACARSQEALRARYVTYEPQLCWVVSYHLAPWFVYCRESRLRKFLCGFLCDICDRVILCDTSIRVRKRERKKKYKTENKNEKINVCVGGLKFNPTHTKLF